MRRKIYEEAQNLSGLFSFLQFQQTDGKGDIPDEIISALAEWVLLYEVPFPYMVVREEMLPPESIRFFYLDRNYIFALLDGAMSPGRSFSVDYRHDIEIIDKVLGQTIEESRNIRPKLQGKAVQKEEMPINANEENITGFLLRSVLVEGFRGLEFKAYGEDEKTPLRALRLETLGSQVLLGLYAGEISRLEIAQPPEGMHFGFARKQSGGFEKRLRSLEDGALLNEKEALVDVVMHNEPLRVVDLAETMQNIQKGLGLAETDSAVAALEMIQNPFVGEIRLKKGG